MRGIMKLRRMLPIARKMIKSAQRAPSGLHSIVYGRFMRQWNHLKQEGGRCERKHFRGHALGKNPDDLLTSKVSHLAYR